MAGVLVRLYRVQNGLRAVDETTSATALLSDTQTNASGHYAFAPLNAGRYEVEFVTPNGYSLTRQINSTVKDNSDSDVDLTTHRTPIITLTVGETSVNHDAGYWQPLTIGDRVWVDANQNGQRDSVEVGLANVVVQLWRNGRVVSTTTTNNDGDYVFAQLTSGTYSLSFQASSNYTFTHANIGPDATDSDILHVAEENDQAPVGHTDPFDISPNHTAPQIAAGFVDAEAFLELNKSVETGRGGNGDSVLPGHRLTYTLEIRNTGLRPVAVTNLVITDPLDANMVEYIAGSAIPAVWEVRNGSVLEWRFAELNPGESKMIQFAVRIKAVPNGIKISNTAYAKGGSANATAVVRKSSRVDNPLEPAAVTLSNFSAHRVSSGMLIRWTTTSEINSWSFSIYRVAGILSSQALPIEAEKISPVAILAEGRAGSGAVYQFLDTTARPNQTYSYWLLETELDGTTNVYGPAKQQANGNHGATRIYLPLLRRN